MGFFASWMTNPAMLGLGALAVSVPIIIHLLNKRRFKIVNWAAMDFLFDADKKNRRRVRLENFLLLMLRCLIMLLIGLMLARPFLPSSIAKNLSRTQQYERVVLLDDSLSQMVQTGNETAFDVAKERIKGLLRGATENNSEDLLTLYLFSDPEKPVLNNEPITIDTLETLAQTVDDLTCSDLRADYPAGLSELKRHVESQTENINRVVYIVSDLRETDWNNLRNDSEDSVSDVVKSISDLENVAGTFVVDVGNDKRENLTIVEIKPEDLLVANTVVRFNVTVANQGSIAARDVNVRFNVGDLPPELETIDELGPGEEKTLTFRFMFNFDRGDLEGADIDERLKRNNRNYLVHAEIVQDGQIVDELQADSLADYAARVLNGTPILLVDGHLDQVAERSETHYLQSVEVKGTGWLQDTISQAEFESAVSLSKYRVIYICNVDEFSTDRVKALEQWVAEGNALVLMPGNRVRAGAFNDSFFKEGKGLSPLGLVQIAGDHNRRNWQGFDVEDAVHPALRELVGIDNMFDSIKIFNWWKTVIAEGQADKLVSVPVRLDDEDNSILMAEKSYGKGRVVAFSIPADIDWTFWPIHPSFSPIMFELAKYLVNDDSDQAAIRVGGGVSIPVDLTAFKQNVSLIDPAKEKTKISAQPFDDTKESENSVFYQARIDDVRKRGVYEMQLDRRHESEADSIFFAANVDPQEGELKRVDANALSSSLGSSVKLITGEQMEQQTVSGGQNEIWLQLLLLLGCCLGVEQFLGWWFGRRR